MWKRILADLKAVWSQADGGVLMMFSLAAPLVFGGAAIAVDSAALYRIQARLQTVGDSTALAAAKEIAVYGSEASSIEESSKSRVEALLAEAELSSAPHSVDVDIDMQAQTAQVTITLVATSILPVSVFTDNPITIVAEASLFGGMRVCVLALGPDKPETIRAKETGTMLAAECAIQSNSKDPASIHSETGGRFVAEQICSSGGVSGPGSAFAPEPAKTDCPAIPDPLAGRAPPAFGGCDSKPYMFKSGTATITPGVYCKGISIGNKAAVTAEPGIYVIKGGSLSVGQDGALLGENVHFYFADDKALFQFADRAVIDLSAPTDGPMAGILFFENQAAKLGRNFHIGSGNVKKLLGTIYLPKGTLNIDAKGDVAAQSAYTVIIAQSVDLKVATLVVNADYSATKVPVPDALSGLTGEIRLAR